MKNNIDMANLAKYEENNCIEAKKSKGGNPTVFGRHTRHLPTLTVALYCSELLRMKTTRWLQLAWTMPIK